MGQEERGGQRRISKLCGCVVGTVLYAGFQCSTVSFNTQPLVAYTTVQVTVVRFFLLHSKENIRLKVALQID